MAEDTTTMHQEDTLRPEPLPWRLAYGMLGPPIVWGVHFLVIYGINALGCWAGLTGWTVAGLIGQVVVVGLVTLVALALIGWASWIAYHAWRNAPHGTHGDSWQAYVGLAGALLGGLFALAVVLETVPMFVLAPCA
jgi:hypothetical protein